MASKACLARLGKEYQRLGKDPLPDIDAEPRHATHLASPFECDFQCSGTHTEPPQTLHPVHTQAQIHPNNQNPAEHSTAPRK